MTEPPLIHQLHGIVREAVREGRKHKVLALVAFLLPLLAAGGYAFLAVPKYSATGIVQVASAGNLLASPLSELGGSEKPEVATEVHLMRRRGLVVPVLRELGLQLQSRTEPSLMTFDWSIASGARSPIEPTLERVRAELQRAHLTQPHRGWLDFELSANKSGDLEVAVDGERRALPVGEPRSIGGMDLGLRAPPLSPGEAVSLRLLSDGELFARAELALKVRSIGSSSAKTNLVSVSYTSADRELSAAVVDRIMTRYVEQDLAWQTESASSAATFIEGRLAEVRADLEARERSLQQFSEENRGVQLDTQARVTIEELGKLEADRQAADVQERVVAGVIRSLNGRLTSGNLHLTASFFDDPVLVGSVAALSEAETKHQLLHATLTPDHPEVRQLEGQLVRQRAEVLAQLRSLRKSLVARRGELDGKLQEFGEELAAFPAKQLQLARLVRDVGVTERVHAFLLEKHHDARILEASTTTDKRIVDAAAVPFRRSAPLRGRTVGFGFILGLVCMGVALVTARLLGRKLDSVAAVKDATPWPAYGSIPEAPEVAERLFPSAVWSGTSSTGPMAEAFRGLAVAVGLCPPQESRGTIVQVTSSRPGEGKSGVAANLAVAMTKVGANVVIVDLDLRKPTQHRLWKTRRAPGYSDVAASKDRGAAVAEVLREQAFGNAIVNIVTAGARSPDTMPLLTPPLVSEILGVLARRFDYVIVDSPPAFVPDTSAIARHADVVLMVARPGHVERGELQQAVDVMGRIDAAKGLVLNGVSRTHAGYGSPSYYYYHAEYGGAERVGSVEEGSAREAS